MLLPSPVAIGSLQSRSSSETYSSYFAGVSLGLPVVSRMMRLNFCLFRISTLNQSPGSFWEPLVHRVSSFPSMALLALLLFFEPEAIQPVLSSTLDCGIANVGVLLKLFFQSSHFEVVIPFPSKTEDWAENRDSLSEFNSGSFSVMWDAVIFNLPPIILANLSFPGCTKLAAIRLTVPFSTCTPCRALPQ